MRFVEITEYDSYTTCSLFGFPKLIWGKRKTTINIDCVLHFHEFKTSDEQYKTYTFNTNGRTPPETLTKLRLTNGSVIYCLESAKELRAIFDGNEDYLC